MRINTRFAASLSSVALFHVYSLLVVLPAATAQDVEFVVAELGGVSVISIPQPSPIPGLLATKVVLRTAPENKLVTFENVSISGAVHQVWPARIESAPTPFVDLDPRSFWTILAGGRGWVAADSHVLISTDMVVGGLWSSFGLRSESNDYSNLAGASQSLPAMQYPAITGIGDISMEVDTDSFSLHSEFQTNEIEFAYVVTPAASTGADGDVFFTVGVLGEGIINSGEPGGASFGFNGNAPLVIPFVPEPSAVFMAVFALAAVSCLRNKIEGPNWTAPLCVILRERAPTRSVGRRPKDLPEESEPCGRI